MGKPLLSFLYHFPLEKFKILDFLCHAISLLSMNKGSCKCYLVGEQGIPCDLLGQERKEHQGHHLQVHCLPSSPLAILPVIHHLPLEIWPQTLLWLKSTLPLSPL